jgi:predicted lipoprotein with Yx(FWY)xxD motif
MSVDHRIVHGSTRMRQSGPVRPKYRRYRVGRKCVTAIAAAFVAAAMLTACGGGSSNNNSSSNNGGGNGGDQTKTAGSGGKATISVAKSKLGSILVDSQGDTVYLFEKDTGPKSTCSGECATVWPPVTSSGTPTAGSGVDAAKLKTVDSNGKSQVVYNGHPLYTFEGDSSPGDTTGQGNTTFGAGWFVLSPAGDKIG